MILFDLKYSYTKLKDSSFEKLSLKNEKGSRVNINKVIYKFIFLFKCLVLVKQSTDSKAILVHAHTEGFFYLVMKE